MVVVVGEDHSMTPGSEVSRWPVDSIGFRLFLAMNKMSHAKARSREEVKKKIRSRRFPCREASASDRYRVGSDIAWQFRLASQNVRDDSRPAPKVSEICRGTAWIPRSDCYCSRTLEAGGVLMSLR